jgi:hypothetical protein
MFCNLLIPTYNNFRHVGYLQSFLQPICTFVPLSILVNLSMQHSVNRLSTLHNMGLEYIRKSCTAIKTFKYPCNFIQNVRKNTLSLSPQICATEAMLYLNVVARIRGICTIPAASVLYTRESVVLVI